MLYCCIPVHDEAPTVGVLLWRIRAVFREYSCEFEIVVFNDGSTDATAETLAPYADVLPLTVIGSTERRGYAAAIDGLCRHVARAARYARRDAMILMQGDFTDPPEHIPELVKRFEGGADVVLAERAHGDGAPAEVRRLRQLAPWVLKPFVQLPGVVDPLATMRLMRIATVKDLVKAAGERPVVQGEGWEANLDLLAATMPHTRRIETVTLAPRYDLRLRPSRRRAWRDAVRLGSFAWGARARLKQAATSRRAAS